MAQLFTFNLGVTGKAATTGYEFFDSANASLGARSVSGVSEGLTGIYSVSLTPPANAVEIRWNDTDTGGNGVDTVLIDAAVSSRSTYAGGDTAGTTTMLADYARRTGDYSTLTQAQVTGGAYALNHASFAFNAALDFTTTQKAATLARVTLTDTVTTYTGNTPQTGDAFARIGVAGVGLTNIVLPSGGLANVTAWTVNLTGNITGNLTGTIGGITAACAAQFFTLNSTKLYADAVAGSIVKETSSGAVGGATAATIADAVWDEVSSGHITVGTTGYSLSLISVGNVTVVSPVSLDGETITLTRGSDYYQADGNELSFSSADFPVLTSGSVVLNISGMKITGTITSATACYFQMTRIQTASILQSLVPYTVVATLSSGRIVEIVRGEAVINT